MNNFVVRTITGVLFVAVVVTCFLKPLAMVGFFALVTGLSIWEFTGLVNQRENVKVNRFISTVAGVYLFLAFAGWCMQIVPSAAFVPYLITVVYLFISEIYQKNEDAINDWAYTMLSQMYVALPFVFLWCNDTGAYLSGSLLGKHKLFPRISPAKSWEGSIGGGILVCLVAWLMSYIDHNNLLENFGATPTGLNTLQWIGMGVVVVFFGTWGDLVESLFKRTLGVKDSGNILPGHGGMLDRFDSSLMAIPAVVVYVMSVTM